MFKVPVEDQRDYIHDNGADPILHMQVNRQPNFPHDKCRKQTFNGKITYNLSKNTMCHLWASISSDAVKGYRLIGLYTNIL